MHQPSKVHDIFTNFRHITTKTTSSIKATPEPAPIPIYVVCSIPVRIVNYCKVYPSLIASKLTRL